jgi:hypothetical protein
MDVRALEFNCEYSVSTGRRLSNGIDGTRKFKLVFDDGSKTPVARSHRRNARILGKPCQARLEILPGYEHLVDILLVTFIYLEKLRKQKEREPYIAWSCLLVTVKLFFGKLHSFPA